MINAIILAAGFSRRIGTGKLLLEVNEKPLVEWVIDLVSKFYFKEKILIYRHEQVKLIGQKKGFKTIFNNHASDGMSSSVKLGIINSCEADGYMFFNGDQPFLTYDIIDLLINSFYEKKGTIIVPRYDGKNGTPVIFSSQWKGELLNISGDKGGREIIKNNLDKAYFQEILNKKAGLDIDTWEDYNMAVNGVDFI